MWHPKSDKHCAGSIISQYKGVCKNRETRSQDGMENAQPPVFKH